MTPVLQLHTVRAALLLSLLAAPAWAIQGLQYNDLNGDSLRAADEPGLPGWTVFLDSNANGRRDPAEPTALTAADGSFAFTGLAPGRYVVSNVQQQGWLASAPRGVSFATTRTFAAGNGPRLPIAADLNGDGTLDLVAANVYTNNITLVLSNAGGTYAPPVNLPVGNAPRYVLAYDLDGDGDLDLTVTNMDSRTVSVLKNQGNGTFAPPISYLAGNGAWIVLAADLDKDGDPDLAVMNQNANNVTLLANTGGGNFTFAGSLTVGNWPHDMVLTDFDGDGSVDIAVANMLSSEISILYNRGNGTFDPKVALAVGNGPLHVRVADLDADGKPDIAVDHLYSNNVMVMYNGGNRTFTAPQSYPAGLSTHDLVVCDLDLDGDLDLAALAYTSEQVSILLNQGKRTFAAGATYTVGHEPMFLLPSDLDGDGDRDLVVSNTADNNLTVLVNNGDATFAAGPTVPVGANPRFIAMADVDGDGDEDAVAANFDGAGISLCRNIRGQLELEETGSTPANVGEFGSRQATGIAEQAGGGNTFKVRVGDTGFKSLDVRLGAAAVTRPVKIRRIAGQQSTRVRLDAVLVEGDPAFWNYALDARALAVGPVPTLSRADVDQPGTLANKPGDGDVDNDDLAILEGCYTGAGLPISAVNLEHCVQTDLDGDLDVDDQDRALLMADFTGPAALSWSQAVNLTASASSAAPIGATARVQILATDMTTGESHSAFAVLRKQPYQVAVAPIQRSDFTSERSSKLIYTRSTSFDMIVISTGTEADQIEVRVAPISGFTFQTIDSVTRQPKSVFSTDPAPEKPSFPGSIKAFTLNVTAPASWARGAQATIHVTARSVSSGLEQSYDLKVTKAGALWSPSDLLVSGGRRHRMLAGKSAVFGLTVTNPLTSRTALTLSAAPVSPRTGWTSMLKTTSVTLDPNASANVQFLISAPSTATVATYADYTVTLKSGTTTLATSRLGAVVTKTPKVIFVSMDALSPGYLDLNAAGTAAGSSGNWLMPNVRSFLSRATRYSGSLAGIPSVTDQNQTSVLTGTPMGLSGIGSLIHYFNGRDSQGEEVIEDPTPGLLRYGPNGDEVLSIFDIARKMDPNSCTVHSTGKWWVDNYVVGNKPSGGGSMAVDGFGFPMYVGPPEKHVIGDPPSDVDAAQDPALPPYIANWGGGPGLFPSDRWIMESSLKILDTQDPDIMFILLAGTDDAGHMLGAAWDPAKWDNRGTASTWDDVNKVNPACIREEMLDVVRESDTLFGTLTTRLQERGILDNTYIVLVSDHGMISCSPHRLDIGELLEAHGYSNKDDFNANAGGPIGLFFNVAPAEQQNFEWVLENGPSIAPGLDHNPWVVIDRAEMRTGIDAHTGIRFGQPDELYSEFFAEHNSGDTSMAKWPDFLVLFQDTWQTVPLHFESSMGEEESLEGEAFNGGHGFLLTQPNVLVMSGPGVPRARVISTPVRIVDIAPTLYKVLRWPVPTHVRGTALPGVTVP